MRVLNETDKYLSSINEQTEEKEVQNTQDILNGVKEVFSALTSAVKDLEGIMVNLNMAQTSQAAETAETEPTETVEE